MTDAEYPGLDSSATLTDWEWVGLRSFYNLADGHAHFPLPDHFRAAVDSMPGLFTTIEGPDLRRVFL